MSVDVSTSRCMHVDRLLSTASGEATFSADSAGHLSWNAAASHLYGSAPGAPPIPSLEALIPGEPHAVWSVVASRGSWAGRSRQTRRDGQSFEAHVVIRRLEGASNGCVASVWDVDRLKSVSCEQTILAEAGRVVASSLELSDTLQSIARLVADSVGDCCIIDLLTESGELHRVAGAHRDPGSGWQLDLLLKHKIDPKRPYLAHLPITTGRSLLVAALDPEQYRLYAQDAGHLRKLHLVAPTTLIAVPLVARTRMLGTAMLLSSRPNRQYDENDLRLAEQLCARAALAIDNAQLHGKLHQTAAALEEALRATHAERDRLRVTLGSIGEGVLATDDNKRVTLINRVAEQLTGWTLDDALGRSLEEIFAIRHDDDPVLVHRGGAVTPVRYTMAPIRADREGLSGWVIAFQDRTAETRVATERERTRRLDALGVLAAVLAHDYNNVLAMLAGNLGLARRHAGPGVLPFLANAEKAIERATALTRQLVAFAPGGAPARTLHDASSLVREALRSDASSLPLRLSVEPELWAIEVDSDQVGDAVRHLVRNAIDAGATRVDADVANALVSTHPARTPTRYVRIVLTDDGEGMDEAALARACDPFFSTRPNRPGLGLAVAHAVVTRHGGVLRLESMPGHGTTVTIDLPASEPLPATTPPSDRSQVRAARVLVMDDEPELRAVMSAMLTMLGHTCETAADGREAVDRYAVAIAENQPFDAVILDLTVKHGMGGAEALRQLRSIDPEVRAIVASGYSHDPIVADFHRHGFKAALRKPFSTEDVSAELGRALRR